MRHRELLDFWFTEPVRSHWFSSTPELDREIHTRFITLWATARDGGLESWEHSADGTLALVILLDQAPLNMFRGLAKGFSTENAARAVADRAIHKGLDREMRNEHKAFLYMPYMHSESLTDQDRSLALYEHAGLMQNLQFARHHREIVRRFGRFPHRNAILGRQSTQEELDWMLSKDAFTG